MRYKVRVDTHARIVINYDGMLETNPSKDLSKSSIRSAAPYFPYQLPLSFSFSLLVNPLYPYCFLHCVVQCNCSSPGCPFELQVVGKRELPCCLTFFILQTTVILRMNQWCLGKGTGLLLDQSSCFRRHFFVVLFLPLHSELPFSTSYLASFWG